VRRYGLKSEHYSEERRKVCGCGTTTPEVLCTPETCGWYINSEKFFNCFLVYKHYIQENQHTLQEVAALMDISHTTVKQIENQALGKIKELVKDGRITLNELRGIISSK